MDAAPLYSLDRSLCARCGNEGTLKHEGILDGCPECPRGREVAKQLDELARNAVQAGTASPDMYERAGDADDDRGTVCSCGGDPDTCAANQAVIAQITAAEDWTGVYPS